MSETEAERLEKILIRKDLEIQILKANIAYLEIVFFLALVLLIIDWWPL